LTPGQLARANAALPAASLFGAPLTLPQLAVARPMDTLASLAAGATGVSVAQVAEHNADQPLTPAVTLVTQPQQYTVPPTLAPADNTLRKLAALLGCNLATQPDYLEAPLGLLPANWKAPVL